MGYYCSELFAERNGYFVVIGDLFIIESCWLVVGNALFLSGHFGNEPEKTSGVLCTLAGLYPSPPILSDIFCNCFCNLLVQGSNYTVVGILLSSLITFLD